MFVMTGKEEEAAEQLRKCLDEDEYAVFVPTKDYSFKKKGKVTKIVRTALISGYVFIATKNASDKAVGAIEPLLFTDPKLFRLLSNNGRHGESKAFTQKDRDVMAAFLDILDDDFHIPAFAAVDDGERIQILENHLEKHGGEITKVNRNQSSATVRLQMLGQASKCEVALLYRDSVVKSGAKPCVSASHPLLRREPVVLRVGDMVEVVSGSVAGCDGKIVEVDGRTVVVRVDVLGTMRDVRVGVDEVRRSEKVTIKI